MTHPLPAPAARPRVTLRITDTDDGRAHAQIIEEGVPRHQLEDDTVSATQIQAASWIAANIAARYARPVLVEASDPVTDWRLAVSPDGSVQVLHEFTRIDTAAPTPAASEVRMPTHALHDTEATEATNVYLLSRQDDDTISDPLMPVIDRPRIEQAPLTALTAKTTATVGLPDFLNPVKPAPEHGWRRTIHQVTGGRVNLGQSATDQQVAGQIDRIKTRVTRPYVIAVMCLKGGIGKTSTTAGVGLTLAHHRGDRVIALDANPDAGDLYERTVGADAPATLTDLADHADDVHNMGDLARYSGISDRLTVIAGDQEPVVSESLSADDFAAALRLVQSYFHVVLVDCGTGVTHPSMSGILHNADAVVIAGSYAVNGARRAEATLRWLQERYPDLANSATVVLTEAATVSNAVNRQAIEQTLGTLAATVVTVPHDQAVADGAVLRLDAIAPRTRQAYLSIAASLAKRFR